jgi:hypothetical protein
MRRGSGLRSPWTMRGRWFREASTAQRRAVTRGPAPSRYQNAWLVRGLIRSTDGAVVVGSLIPLPPQPVR